MIFTQAPPLALTAKSPRERQEVYMQFIIHQFQHIDEYTLDTIWHICLFYWKAFSHPMLTAISQSFLEAILKQDPHNLPNIQSTLHTLYANSHDLRVTDSTIPTTLQSPAAFRTYIKRHHRRATFEDTA